MKKVCLGLVLISLAIFCLVSFCSAATSIHVDNTQAGEGKSGTVTCPSGQKIVSWSSKYGANCGQSCPINCGACKAGSSSCTITFSNTFCGRDCAPGCIKDGDLSITCKASQEDKDKCPANFCKDSDGGKNYDVKGYLNGGGGGEDWCTINEGNGGYVESCSGQNCKLIELFCDTSNCGSNYVFKKCSGSCVNGACCSGSACGSSCCGKGKICGNTSTGVCCNKGEIECGGKCINPKKQVCCKGNPTDKCYYAAVSSKGGKTGVVTIMLNVLTGYATKTKVCPLDPCSTGKCGVAAECDDKNECTQDSCDPESKCKNAPLNGKSCSVSGKEGFCMNGTCKESTCENIYGKDYEKCGKGAGLNCCFKGQCKEGICCDKNRELTFFSVTIKKYPLCSAKNCSANMKVCLGTSYNECCPINSTCLVSNKKVGSSFVGGDCGREVCGAGETPCPSKGGYFTKGVLCCNANQTCIENPPGASDYPYCNDNTCSDGNGLCKGKGEQSWRIKCCKIGVETCSWNPDGYPLCIQLSSMKV